MCLICVEMSKNTLTSMEAKKNLIEMKNTIPKEHIVEVCQMIQNKENEEREYPLDWLEDEHYGDTD